VRCDPGSRPGCGLRGRAARAEPAAGCGTPTVVTVVRARSLRFVISCGALGLVLALGTTACRSGTDADGDGDPAAAPASPTGPGFAAPSTVAAADTTAPAAPTAPRTPSESTPLPDGVRPRPAWLGTRPLPVRPDGFGEMQATPRVLRDRRFVTVDHLPPPEVDAFAATIDPVPPGVAARSTWSPACPVTLDDLRYVTVTFWGFDGAHHTGELLVHAGVATDVVAIFERLHAARYPIEEMRVVRADELDAPPTGDGNNTSAFVCRPAVGTTAWSEHAYGRAIDVNPFHNPYVRDDVVLPELARAYVDRADLRPGMIVAGDAVTQAFAAAGWRWGGDFRSSSDPMHFSTTGR
jgi:hypothetical protein